MAFFKELFFVFVLLGATLAAPTFLRELEDAKTEDEKTEDVTEQLNSLAQRLHVLKDATKSLEKAYAKIPKPAVEDASKKSSFAEIAKEDEAADKAIEQDLKSVPHDTKKEHKAAQTGSGLRDGTYKKSIEKKEPEVPTDDDKKLENDLEKLTNDLSKLKDTFNKIKPSLDSKSSDNVISQFDMAFGQKDGPPKKDEKPAEPEFVLHHKDMADTDEDEDDDEDEDEVEDEAEKPKQDSGILETGAARTELLKDLQGDVVEAKPKPEGPKPVYDYDHHVDMADTVAPEEPKEDTEMPDYSESDDEYIGGPPGTIEDEQAGGPPGTQDDAVTKKEVVYEEPPPYDDDDDEDVEDIEEAVKRDEQEKAEQKAEEDEQETLEKEADEQERAALEAEEDLKKQEEEDEKRDEDELAEQEAKEDEQETLEKEADEQELAAQKAEEDLKKQNEEDEKRDELLAALPLEAEEVKDDVEEKVGEPKEEVVQADAKVVADDKTFIENAPDKDAAKEHTEPIEDSKIQHKLEVLSARIQGIKGEIEEFKRRVVN